MGIPDTKSKFSHMEGEFSFYECTHTHNLTKGTVGNLRTLSIESKADFAAI